IAGAEPLGLTSPPVADPPVALPAHARTHIAPMPVGPPSGPLDADPGPARLSNGPGSPRSHSASTPPGPPGHGMGYPVMNAELSAQIATGASVFPSEPARTSSPHPAPSAHAMPAVPTGPTMPSGPFEFAPTVPLGAGPTMPSGPHGPAGSMMPS